MNAKIASFNKQSGVKGIDVEPESEAARDVVKLQYGVTSYPLRQPRREVFQNGTYSLMGFADHLTGRGETLTEARENFMHSFHEKFQEVRRTWPSLRDTKQGSLWEAFSSLINIEEYDNMRTFVFPHDIGRVLDAKNNGYRTVRWHEEKDERIALVDAPAEFASFRIGIWFEAVVERSRSGDFVRIQHASSLAAPPVFSKQDREKFWNQQRAPEQNST